MLVLDGADYRARRAGCHARLRRVAFLVLRLRRPRPKQIFGISGALGIRLYLITHGRPNTCLNEFKQQVQQWAKYVTGNHCIYNIY